MTKVDTIEQYKILEFIKDNFVIDNLEIELVAKHLIRVKDLAGAYMTFKYANNEITYIYK